MKVIRNIAAPIVSIVVYVIALFIGVLVADFISAWELNEITYRIQRAPFNPYWHFIVLAVVRAVALQISIVISTYVSVPTNNGFLPGTFFYALLMFCLSAFALINIFPSLFVSATFENIIYLIEELVKAAISGLFIFFSFKCGNESC